MASPADARRYVKNSPLRVYGVIVSSTTGLPITGGLTALAATISTDGGAFAATITPAGELGTTGFFQVDLAVAETSFDRVILKVSATNANAVTYIKQIEFEAASDSGLAQSAAASTLVLRAGASASDGFYSGQQVEIVRGTGAGQTRAITGYIGASVTCAIDRAWITNPDATSVYVISGQGSSLGNGSLPNVNVTQINSSAAAAAALGYLYKGGVVQASVNDVAPAVGSFIGANSLSAIDDFYQGALLIFVTGALAGEAERISSYVGASRTITMDHVFPASPANTDQFVILGKIR